MMRKTLGTAFLSVVLVACGGGGGGGASTGGITPGGTTGDQGSPRSPTGLMPAQPAPGAVLYADASALRPFRAGATWNYRGTITNNSDSSVTRYITATTQGPATTSSSAFESSTNSANLGPDAQTVVIANGVVSSTENIDFTGKGIQQPVTVIELKSPVRQGDQYNIFDEHFTDTAIDVDRDGKPDALDVAIYAQVVGLQTVQLPNLPSMQAVEVDTTFLSRVTLSSTGQVSPTTGFTIQTWYVSGIGIVRQRTTLPTVSGTSTEVIDEQITSWDGVTAGLGVTSPVEARIPSTNDVFPGRVLPSNFLAGPFAFNDHVLVITLAPDLSFDPVVSSIDLRGRVTGSKVLKGLSFNGVGVATAYGVVYIRPLSGVNYGLTQIDSTGSLVGSVDAVTLNLGGGHIAASIDRLTAAVDGATLWLLFDRYYYDPVNGNVPGHELILRPYTLAGVPVGPEMVVDPYATTEQALAASSGKLLLSWVRQTGLQGPPYSQMFAFAQQGSGTIGPVQALASGTQNYTLVSPLRTGANSALLWGAVPGTNASAGAPGGILLDGNMQLVRAGTTLTDEQIPALAPYQSVPYASDSRIAFVGTAQSGTLWQGDQGTQLIDTFSWMDTTDAPLARTPVNTVRAPSIHAALGVVFADRMLVFGGSGVLTTEVVWLNKGN